MLTDRFLFFALTNRKRKKMKNIVFTTMLAFCTIGAMAQKYRGMYFDLGCPDDNHPHAVDLGLPSGTKWACCNLGAEKPYEDGKYYAWGELESKRYFYFDNYKYYVPNQQEYYMFLGENIAASKYDAATYLLGSGWSLPTDKECRELISSCETTTLRIEDNDVVVFISPNGKRLLMPLAGSRDGDRWFNYGEKGFYWTSIADKTICDLAFMMCVEVYPSVYLGCRNCGYSIRPVFKD